MDRDDRNYENRGRSGQDWPTLSGVPEKHQRREQREEPISLQQEKSQRKAVREREQPQRKDAREREQPQREMSQRRERDGRRQNSRAYQMRMERERAEEEALRRSYMKQWLWMGLGALVLIASLIILLIILFSGDRAKPIESQSSQNTAGSGQVLQSSQDDEPSAQSQNSSGETQGSESQGVSGSQISFPSVMDIPVAGYQTIDLHDVTIPEYVMVDLIEPNMYSRPQKPLTVVNNIVVHYVGNPGTTAANNVDYFKSLSAQSEWDEEARSASSHFVIGIGGEVIQCVPLYEVAYCSNDRNSDTISIECCHPDESGYFTQATYDSLIQLLAHLCSELGLDENDIIRHYDVTGKICPKYYVVNPDAWERLKLDVGMVLTEGL